MSGRIATSKVSPDFLHANSTSHTWTFSAFAEFIDNSYDAKATEVCIDQFRLENQICLSFQDDGSGMDMDRLYKMLSFGFCDRRLSTSIGRYGNGFKSSSMRLGRDAIVFTKTKDTAGIGMLSQTYNNNIDTETVLVPMLSYSCPGLTYVDEENHSENLAAILKHSPFEDEEKLKKQLRQLPKTGTQIIIYNLHKSSDNRYLELDFDTDPEDIRCPEIYDADSQHTSKYKVSLMEYCSILYLKPRMKIKLRGNYVKTRLIAKSLFNTRIDEYIPKGITPLAQHSDQYALRGQTNTITFGFLPESIEDCGMMLYSENRLIKPYEQVSCQKRGVGAGVVGVTQAKFLTPTHMKQDFVKDSKYIAAMAAYNTKLKSYWEHAQSLPSASTRRRSPDSTWVQCDFKSCLKWRRLPTRVNSADLPDKWYCTMHPDNIGCDFPEDMHEDEEITQPPSRSRSARKRKPVNRLSVLIDENRSSRTHSPVSVSSDSESSDHVLLASFPSAAKSSCLPSPVGKKVVGSTSKKVCEVNNKRVLRGTSKKVCEVNNKRVVGSASKKVCEVNNKRVLRGTSKKVCQEDSTEAEGEMLKSGAKQVSKRKSNQQDTNNQDDCVKISVENDHGPDDDVEIFIEKESETNNAVGLSAGVEHGDDVTDGTEHGDDVTGDTEHGDDVTDGTEHGDDVTGDTEHADDMADGTEHGADDAVDLSVDTTLRSDDSPSMVGHAASDIGNSSSVEQRNEISHLRMELNELNIRFNNLLTNSRRLLEMLAPDISLNQNVDIEHLIAKMVEHGIPD